jgi:hypothetical protein
VLRPHELFQQPVQVDLNKSVEIEVPDAWKREIKNGPINVLPLVGGSKQQYRDGWCTYTYEHVQAPELEIVCGGINAKTPRASGIWRQGHLMHFGFEQGPDELNENGLTLLVNSICYISRFTEDRPIVRTPSVFYSNVRLLDRAVIDRLIENEARDLDLYLNAYLSEEERELVRGKDRKALKVWYEAIRGFLHADERGKFKIDKEAQRFGIANDSPAFIPSIVDAADRVDLAQTLRKRYVAIGPETDSLQPWHEWWDANRDYLFFTDTGGFRWLLDPLAKKRGIPTKDLRGPARATRTAIVLAP